MSFERLEEIEQALRDGQLDLQTLYQIWELREPVAQPKEPGKTATPTSQAHLPWMQRRAGLLPHFTRAALALEEHLLVCDVAREALRLEPMVAPEERANFDQLRLDYARALVRLGAFGEAQGQLNQILQHSELQALRALAAQLLGDIAVEQAWQQPSRPAQLQYLRRAETEYRNAVRLDENRLNSRLRLAAVSLQMGATDEAREIARRVLQQAEELGDATFRVRNVRAAALAILGQLAEARQSYSRLADAPDATTAHLAEARYRARFFAEAAGEHPDYFRTAFPPLQLLVFGGDFTESGLALLQTHESTRPIREAIRSKLEQLDARAGLSGASAGTDLLFIDEMHNRAGATHVILPWSRSEFLRTSILPFEPDRPFWEPLFQKALDHASSVRELGQLYKPDSEVGLQYTTEVSAGIAFLIARATRLDVQPIVLSHPLTRDCQSTIDFVHLWQHRLGRQPLRIEPDLKYSATEIHQISENIRSSERSTVQQQVKTMLFADIVGYSKLTEHAVPEFVEFFLGRVAQLAAVSRHGPRSVNTWGDAIYAVFDFTHDAGCFALDLIRMIQNHEADWLRLGLYWESEKNNGTDPEKHPLNIRVGLHTGPVFLTYDPVVCRLVYNGAHVSRAARIEPVTRRGQAYASEEFAALVELGNEIARLSGEYLFDRGFVCEYAGSMPLAKDYPGRYRIYRLLPRIDLQMELLAQTVHERYRREATARGETRATNVAMAPWEELPEDLRDANRAQVADLPNKLRALGYELSTLQGMDPDTIAISSDTLEELARREHTRWSEERRRQGWTYAKLRDDARKHHPLLVPWAELNEVEREKDRAAVRNAPILAAEAGFRVRKI